MMRIDRHAVARRCRRALPGALTLLLLAGAWAGCRDRSAPRRKDSISVHVESEPAHLVSLLRPDAWAHRITQHNLFESLVRLDPKSYEPQGELASTWTVSEDKLTYTFYLRDGVRWHDGKPFTGADVKFTFDRVMDPAVPATGARSALEPFVESYELVKPQEFRIVCSRPSPWLLTSITDLPILPAHIMGKGDLGRHPALRRPIGTGPYRFVEWKTGQQIVLERFDGYWGAKPRIGRIVYRIIHDPDTAIKLARRGELDFISRVRAAHWTDQVQRDPIFRHEFITTRHYPPGTSYIVLNHQRPLFQDARVRQALAKLLDLETIIDKILGGLGERIGGLYWFKDPHYNRAVKPVAFDPDGAARLLREAGFTDSDDNGVLDRDGKPFKFTFLVVTSSKSARRWLTVYQQQLSRAGIIMDINPLDWSTYLARLQKQDFDAGTMSMIQAGPFSDLYYQFHSSQIGDGQNYGAYRDERVDRLLEQVRATVDPEQRKPLSLELQRILAEEMAVIPLYAFEDPGLVHRKVHGVHASAMWYQVRDWWIE